MTSVYKASPEEKAEILDFLNMVFSMEYRPHDFRTLMPKVYGESNCCQADHYIAREGGRIVGVVGMLAAEEIAASHTLRTGLVGSVSTHPYARGAGHMRECMRLMLSDAEARGLQMLSLGGDRQRYEHFGFTQGGMVVDFSIKPCNVRHAWRAVDTAGITFGSFCAYADEAVDLLNGQICHTARAAADFPLYARTWNGMPFAVLRDERFIGYVVASDDSSWIYEMGLADEADCAAVIKAFQLCRAENGVCVEVPVWNKGRIRLLSAMAQETVETPAKMYRILDFPAAIRACLEVKAAYARLAEGRFTLAADDAKPIEIRIGADGIAVFETDAAPDARLNRLEAQSLLLSARRCADTVGLPACAENWFPLPISRSRVDGF